MVNMGRPRMKWTASQICRTHNVVHNEGSDAERRCHEEQRQTTILTSSKFTSNVEEPKRDDSHLPEWALTGRKAKPPVGAKDD